MLATLLLQQPATPIAVVLEKTGTVKILAARGDSKNAEVTDLLYAGDHLEAKNRGSVTLSFLFDGHRERLKLDGKASVTERTCTPPEAIDVLTTPAQNFKPNWTGLNALRVEGGKDLGSGPGGGFGGFIQGGFTPMPGGKVLSPTPAFTWTTTGVAKNTYRIQVVDSKSKKPVWTVETSNSSLPYPKGEKALPPGQEFEWRVFQGKANQPNATQKFSVASSDEARELEALKKQLGNSADPAELLMGVAKYHAAGAQDEAVELLRRHIKVAPHIAATRLILAGYHKKASRLTEADLVVKWAQRSVAYSPDGKTLASGSQDTSITLWDAEGNEKGALTGHTDEVNSVAFSSDSKTLASGSSDNTIKVWDIATGTEQFTLKETSKVSSVAISPDGKTIAAGGNDKTIKLWDVATRKERDILKGHTAALSCVAFSPDGKTLVSCGGGAFKLWDVATGKELHSIPGHMGKTSRIAFSQDGKKLVSGGSDRTIKIWDAATGNELTSLAGEAFYCVAISPDGKTVAGGAYGTSIKLLDTATGKVKASLDLKGIKSVFSLAFSPDGKTLASASEDKTIKLWKVQNMK